MPKALDPGCAGIIPPNRKTVASGTGIPETAAHAPPPSQAPGDLRYPASTASRAGPLSSLRPIAIL